MPGVEPRPARPATCVSNWKVRSDELAQALKYSGMLGRWLEKNPPQPPHQAKTGLDGGPGSGVRVLGPASAPLARLKSEYRYHFILKSQSRERLNAVLRALLDFAAAEKIPRGKLVVDVDPVSLL